MLGITTSQEEVNRDLTGPSEEGQPCRYTTVCSLFSTFENKCMLVSGATWSLLRTILGDTSSTPMASKLFRWQWVMFYAHLPLAHCVKDLS